MTQRAPKLPFTALALRFFLCLAPLLAVACQSQQEAAETMPERDIQNVMNAHVDHLMALPGVAAVAIGALPDGIPCIKVYVVELTEDLADSIPTSLQGHPVVVEESGEIKPFGADG